MVIAISDNSVSEETTKRAQQRKLEWSKVKEPSNQIALRAVEQYNAAKQKRIEKQNLILVEEAKKK